MKNIIFEIEKKLNAPNLSEEWHNSFLNLLISLEKFDKEKSEKYLDAGIDTIKQFVSQKPENTNNLSKNSYNPPEELFKKLAEGGACIEKVLGCFVLTDPKDLTLGGGDGKFKKPEFAPKT